MQQRPAQPPATRRPQTSGATQRCLNPGFSERIGNSRRAGVVAALDDFEAGDLAGRARRDLWMRGKSWTNDHGGLAIR